MGGSCTLAENEPSSCTGTVCSDVEVPSESIKYSDAAAAPAKVPGTASTVTLEQPGGPESGPTTRVSEAAGVSVGVSDGTGTDGAVATAVGLHSVIVCARVGVAKIDGVGVVTIDRVGVATIDRVGVALIGTAGVAVAGVVPP
jgi:hypothetical protein